MKPQKPYKGMGMEGPVAKWYASTTRNGMEEFRALAARVARETPGPAVLEVAPGPGYVAVEMAKLGLEVTALDISRTFVDIASRNADAAGVMVDFRLGNVSDMPFESELFDFIFCRAAFKNFSEPVRALQEMYRVLRPGGRALIMDLRRDTTPASISEAMGQWGLNPVNRAIVGLTFRYMLLKRAYTKREFEEFLRATSFRQTEIVESTIGLEIRLEKQPAPLH